MNKEYLGSGKFIKSRSPWQLNCELLELLITYSLFLLSVTYSIDLNNRPSPTLMLQFMSVIHRLIDKVWKFMLRPLPFNIRVTEFGLFNASVRKWDISFYINSRHDMGSSLHNATSQHIQAIESVTTVFLILSALCTAYVCKTIESPETVCS